MSYQKPLVTIELDEYLMYRKYMKSLEECLTDDKNPFRLALTRILEELLKTNRPAPPNYQNGFSSISGYNIDGNPHQLFSTLKQVLIGYGIEVKINGDKIELEHKKINFGI